MNHLITAVINYPHLFMGAKEAEIDWRDNSGFDMILVTDKGELILTEGMAKFFILGESQSASITVIHRWKNGHCSIVLEQVAYNLLKAVIISEKSLLWNCKIRIPQLSMTF